MPSPLRSRIMTAVTLIQNTRSTALSVLTAVAAVYLGVGAASHYVPLDSRIEFPIVLVGWLLGGFVAAVHWSRRRHPSASSWRDVLRPWHLSLLFALLIGSATLVAVSGNLPLCGETPGDCIKIDDWRIADGHYYRLHPYDAKGNRDPGQPWVEIGEQAYVDQLGSVLRSAVLFGLAMLCVAWVFAAGLTNGVRHPAVEDSASALHWKMGSSEPE